MEWREARAISCSFLEEAVGGSCGLWWKLRFVEEGKRGELLVVEEGKGGSFTCVGGGKVFLLITRAAGYQEFEGCLRVPALGMF